MPEIVGGLGFGFAFIAILTGSMLIFGIAVAVLVVSLIVK